MATRIKLFTDQSVLEYDQGGFDQWCVYLTRPGINKYAPTDVQYFDRLKQIAQTHSAAKIYSDFIEIYKRVGKVVDADVLQLITEISATYGNDAVEMDILFTILYAGMIAEENKAFTKLGKQVKRLGMHQALVENLTAQQAANFSRGLKWREIDALCSQRGF